MEDGAQVSLDVVMEESNEAPALPTEPAQGDVEMAELRPLQRSAPHPLSCSDIEALSSEAAALTHGLATSSYPLDELESLEKCIAYVTDTRRLADDSLVGDVRSTFIDSVLPSCARTILERSFAADMAERVNVFLKELIGFVVILMPEVKRSHLELLNLLLSPAKQGFYGSCGWESNSMLTERDEEEESVGMGVIRPGAKHCSRFLLDSIQNFASAGGFSRASTVLHQTDVPIWAIKLLLQPICKIRAFLDEVVLEQVVVSWMKVVCDRLLAMDDSTMKSAQKDDLQNIKIYLRLLSHEAKCGLRQLEFCSLELAKKLLMGATLEKKILGLSDIASAAKNLVPSHPTVPTESEYDGEPKLVTEVFLKNWIRQEGLLALIFGDNSHPEIMSRAGPILQFLAKTNNLLLEDLDLVWAAGENKHESLVHIVYGLFAEICSALHMEHIEYLFAAKIQPIKPSVFDAPTFTLLRSLSLAAIPLKVSFSDSGKTEEDLSTSTRFFGIHFAWEMLQDGSYDQLSKESKGHAFAVVRDFLGWQLCFGLRELFLTRCIGNLKRFTTISMSLKVAMAALGTFAQEETQGPLLCRLDEEQLLLSVIFHALTEYKRQAANAAVERTKAGIEEGHTVDTLVLCGTVPHHETMQDFLSLLEFVLTRSSLMLSKEQIDSLWQSLVENTISEADRDRAFAWLDSLLKNSKPGQQPFSDEDGMYILLRKIAALEFCSLSSAGYHLAQSYFYFANLTSGTLPQQVYHARLRAQATNAAAGDSVAELEKCSEDGEPLCLRLIGVEIIWNAALSMRDEEASKKAMLFLSTLYKSPLESIQCYSHGEHEVFVKTCFSWMASPTRALRNAEPDSNRANCERVVCRALNLLKSLVDSHSALEEGEAIGHGTITQGQPIVIKAKGVLKNESVVVHSNDRLSVLNDKLAALLSVAPTRVRIVALGKELRNMNQTISQVGIKNEFSIIVALKSTDDAAAPGGLEESLPQPPTSFVVQATPSHILSRQEYFQELFTMLDLTAPIAQGTWDLLMLLPTNNEMLSDLRSERTGQADDGWSRALDPRSTFKLLYSLQIVQSVIDKECREGKAAWCSFFVANGGVRHLVSVLTGSEALKDERNPKRRICMIQMLQVILQFVLLPEVHGEDPALSLPVSKLSQIEAGTPLLRQAVLGSAGQAPSQLVDQLLALCWSVVPLCGAASEEEIEEVSEIVRLSLLLLVSLCASIEEALLHLWSHQQLKDWLRRVVCLTTNQRVRAIAGDAVLQLCSSRMLADLASQSFSVFFKQLVELQEELGHECSTAEEFYSVLSLLVEQYFNKPGLGIHCAPEELFARLLHWTLEHPAVEKCEAEVDPVLKGCLDLLRLLLLQCPNMVSKSSLSSEVYGHFLEFLFDDCLFAIPSVRDGPCKSELPLCKAPTTRSAAFQLLEEIVSQDKGSMEKLLSLLCDQHSVVDSRTDWQYSPTGMSKSTTGFVGLINQGATCYMNSLLQQLFMTRGFRKDVLKIREASKSKEELADSVLYQLQVIFTGLQESNQRAYDTAGLCKAYKDFEGNSVNPGLQMDADEFCNMLFDKLESAMKEAGEENCVKKHFGGELCNQVISKDCEHVSETVEPFYSISVAVKGKSSLETSLELYVEGDILEGDNKYHCSTCNAKVVALKRCCVRSLPDTLIIHMRRFEFNLEHMRRMKVNDFCTFPTLLDMEPFTKQGLDAADAMGQEGLQPKSYFKYELVGVLVHTGTADSGHYYSFIKDRIAAPSAGEWYQFNDQSVDPWNTASMPSDCFGGMETVMQYDANYQQQVPQSRERMNNAYMLVYERLNSQQAKEIAPYRDEKLSEVIWSENERFWRDKHTFDDQYFAFMASVCKSSVLGASQNRFQVIKMATNYFLSVLCRARDEDTIGTFVTQLKEVYSQCHEACSWLLESAISQDWITTYLLKCHSSRTRQMVAGLIVHALGALTMATRSYLSQLAACKKAPTSDTIAALSLPERAPASVRYIHATVNMLLDGAEAHWRRFTQFFIPLRAFCKFGDIERQYLLSISLPSRLIHFYLGERSPLLASESSKAGVPGSLALKKSTTVMGDRFTTPRVGPLIDTVSELVRCCATHAPASSGKNPYFGCPSMSQAVSQAVQETSVFQREGTAVPHSSSALKMGALDERMVYCDRFYLRLLQEGVNVSASLLLVQHLVWEDQRFSRVLLDVITRGLATSDQDGQDALLLSFAAVLEVEDEFRAWRHKHGLEAFVRTVEACMNMSVGFAMVKFVAELSAESELTRQWLFANKEAWVAQWLIAHKNDEVRYQCQELLQSFLEDIGGSSVPEPSSSAEAQDAALVPTALVESKKTMELFQFLLGLLSGPAQYHMAESFFSFERKELQAGHGASTSYYATVEKRCNPWKLVPYFELLKECVVDDNFRNVFFEGYWNEFLSFFLQLDALKQKNDYNKRELIVFLDWCLEAQDESRLVPLSIGDWPGKPLSVKPSVYCRYLLCKSAHVNLLLAYHLTILRQDYYLRFNRCATSVYYRVLLRYALASSEFLESLLRHVNLKWSIENFYLSIDYEEVANALFEIIRVGAHYSEEFRVFLISVACTRKSERLSYRRVVQCLSIAMQSEEDAWRFCSSGGPAQLSSAPDLLALETKSYGPQEAHFGTVEEEELTKEELSRIAATLSTLLAGVEWMCCSSKEDSERVNAAVAKWPNLHVLLPTLCSYLEKIRSEAILGLTYRALKVLCFIDAQFLESVILLLHQEHINHSTACGGVSLPVIGEVTGPPRFKVHLAEYSNQAGVHEEYYEFLRRLCHIALMKFFTSEEQARVTLNLALLGILESTHVTRSCRKMCDALVNLWSSEVPLRMLLKEHPLLKTLVMRAFTHDHRLLDLDECMRLVSRAFGQVMKALDEEDKSTLVISVSSRLDAVMQLISSADASASELAGMELLRLLKTLNTMARSKYFCTVFLQPSTDRVKAVLARAHTVLRGANQWPQDEIAAHMVSLTT